MCYSAAERGAGGQAAQEGGQLPPAHVADQEHARLSPQLHVEQPPAGCRGTDTAPLRFVSDRGPCGDGMRVSRPQRCRRVLLRCMCTGQGRFGKIRMFDWPLECSKGTCVCIGRTAGPFLAERSGGAASSDRSEPGAQSSLARCAAIVRAVWLVGVTSLQAASRGRGDFPHLVPVLQRTRTSSGLLSGPAFVNANKVCIEGLRASRSRRCAPPRVPRCSHGRRGRGGGAAGPGRWHKWSR